MRIKSNNIRKYLAQYWTPPWHSLTPGSLPLKVGNHKYPTLSYLTSLQSQTPPSTAHLPARCFGILPVAFSSNDGTWRHIE